METQDKESKKNRLDRFLENKLWKLTQIFAPLIAISITIYIFIISQQPAQITIKGINHITLLAPQTELRKDVNILYRNDVIANIAKYTILVQNSSRKDIDGKNVRYLRWYPPQSSTILSADITDKSTGQGDFISVDYSKKDVLEFKIDTLNRGVYAIMDILCSSTKPEPDFSFCKAEGVISGGSVVEENMKFLSEQRQSFLSYVFAGGIWTNLAKIPIFLIGGILIMTIIIAPIATIGQHIENRRKRKRLEGITDDIERYILIKNIDGDHTKKQVKENYEYLSGLTTSQLLVVRHVLEIAINEKDNIFWIGERLSDKEKDEFKSIPDKDKLIDMIIYDILYKGREMIDYILQKKESKSSTKI
jgi:hypothetical protein